MDTGQEEQAKQTLHVAARPLGPRTPLTNMPKYSGSVAGIVTREKGAVCANMPAYQASSTEPETAQQPGPGEEG